MRGRGRYVGWSLPPAPMLRLLFGLAFLSLPAAAQVDSTATPAPDSLTLASLPAPDSLVAVTDSLSSPVTEVSVAGTVAAAARATPAAPTGRSRDPLLGHVFGYLLPGGGHFYAGETGTGLVLLGTAVGGYALAFPALLSQSVCAVVDTYGSCETSGREEMALLWGGAMVLGAAVYSVVDGGRAARRANVRNGYLPGGDRPRVALAAAPAGVAMRVRL